jgi:NAD(P)-dependent dehydrogenase (short-subunit alcohol dehydrogenase family)
MRTDVPESLNKRRQDGDFVVVTGGGGGIGAAIVRRFVTDGWTVVSADINQDALDQCAASVSDKSRVRTAIMDVSARDNVEALATSLGKDGRKVAGLVNAAGLLQDVTPFMEPPNPRQQKIWDVNYFGSVHCTQVFGAMMVLGGGGSIVNITSINELRPLPLHTYAPTKVALGALTTLSAGELGPSGIRVNAIAPGFTLTPIFKEKIASGKRDATVILKHTAMGRLIEPDEIASVASFLMSDDSRAVSGASIPVDAGWLTTSYWMNFRELQQNGPSAV